MFKQSTPHPSLLAQAALNLLHSGAVHAHAQHSEQYWLLLAAVVENGATHPSPYTAAVRAALQALSARLMQLIQHHTPIEVLTLLCFFIHLQ
jgi:hypothetical protein